MGFDPNGTFTPPGTWLDGGSYGTPNPGLPINPDYTGIQPVLLDLEGGGDVSIPQALAAWRKGEKMQFWMDFWRFGKRDIKLLLFLGCLLLFFRHGGLDLSPRQRGLADFALFIAVPGGIMYEFVRYMRERKKRRGTRNGE